VASSPNTTEQSLGEPMVIRIELNDGSRLVTSHKFIYRHNPRFTGIEPRTHLIVCVQFASSSSSSSYMIIVFILRCAHYYALIGRRH